MKTVKLTISNRIDVLDDMRVFSSIVRVAYNRYQDGMDEKECRYVETMAKNIPTNLSPLEYEQELNWKRQQARELINEEISQRYR